MRTSSYNDFTLLLPLLQLVANLLVIPLEPVVPPFDQLLLLVQTAARFEHVDATVATRRLVLMLFDDRNVSKSMLLGNDRSYHTTGIVFPTVGMGFYSGRAIGKAAAISQAGRHEDQIVVGRCQVADGHRPGHEVGGISGKNKIKVYIIE